MIVSFCGHLCGSSCQKRYKLMSMQGFEHIDSLVDGISYNMVLWFYSQTRGCLIFFK